MNEIQQKEASLALLYTLEQGYSQIFRGGMAALLLASGIITIGSLWLARQPFYILGLLLMLLGCYRIHSELRRVHHQPAFLNVLYPALLVTYFSPFYYWWTLMPSRMFFLFNALAGLVALFVLLIQLNRLVRWTGILLKDGYLRRQAAVTLGAVVVLQVAPLSALLAATLIGMIKFGNNFYPELANQFLRLPWWFAGLSLIPLVATLTNCWYARVLCREKVQSKLAITT
jgi:hypothetical protein